ncbi:MAG: YdbL family protein [Kiloniellales bacterium]
MAAVSAALAAVTLLAALPGGAGGQTLDQLRAKGAIGERYDGMAVARDPSAAAMVAEINAKRREIYAERATAEKIPVDQVGMVYAKQIFDQAPSGTMFQDQQGAWTRKP